VFIGHVLAADRHRSWAVFFICYYTCTCH